MDQMYPLRVRVEALEAQLKGAEDMAASLRVSGGQVVRGHHQGYGREGEGRRGEGREGKGCCMFHTSLVTFGKKKKFVSTFAL